MLMSKATGRLLSEYDWADVRTPGYPKLLPLLPLTDGTREKILSQLGTLFSELSKLHFDEIGSMFQDHNGNYVVGECLSPALLWQHRDSLQDYDIKRGPFQHDKDYFEALIAAFTGHCMELPLNPHVFFFFFFCTHPRP